MVDDDDVRAAVTSFFADAQWSANWEGQTVHALYQGKNGLWSCIGHVHERRFVFYSVAMLEVDGQHAAAVAEYITRANDGMVIGNLELSWDSGQVRCRTSIDVDGGELTEAMVRRLVEINVLTMDRYLPGLVDVALGDREPREAIDAAEG
jgi:hypothetical protein